MYNALGFVVHIVFFEQSLRLFLDVDLCNLESRKAYSCKAVRSDIDIVFKVTLYYVFCTERIPSVRLPGISFRLNRKFQMQSPCRIWWFLYHDVICDVLLVAKDIKWIYDMRILLSD